MIYYDIHTHQCPPPNATDVSILSVDLNRPEMIGTEGFFSVGIHPWFGDEALLPLLRRLALDPNVVAIGEAGLDKLAATPYPLQEKLFTSQAELAGSCNKPLIIHCVKAWDDLLRIRKHFHPSAPWIVHGFKGGGQLAAQLVNHGFYLSFGRKFQRNAAWAAWPDRLFAETDEDPGGIRPVYQSICLHLGVSHQELSTQIAKNVQECFTFL